LLLPSLRDIKIVSQTKHPGLSKQPGVLNALNVMIAELRKPVTKNTVCPDPRKAAE